MRNRQALALEEPDVRAVVRLLGEVSSTPGDHPEKKRQLMEGLCQLIDADSLFWGLGVQASLEEAPVYLGLLAGGFNDETYAAFFQAAAHPEMVPIQARFADEIARRKTHLTRHRGQLDPGDSYKKTAAYPLWKQANINGVIMSFRPMGPTSFSVVTLYRRLDGPVFSDRDNLIAHVILSGVPWLHAAGWPEEQGASIQRLSPRQRLAMNLLLQGQTRSKIADHLEISIHTANEHVKAVFAHFGVHSQAELIGRFRSGDGGDH